MHVTVMKLVCTYVTYVNYICTYFIRDSFTGTIGGITAQKYAVYCNAFTDMTKMNNIYGSWNAGRNGVTCKPKCVVSSAFHSIESLEIRPPEILMTVMSMSLFGKWNDEMDLRLKNSRARATLAPATECLQSEPLLLIESILAAAGIFNPIAGYEPLCAFTKQVCHMKCMFIHC
jgi:hypothetical protein